MNPRVSRSSALASKATGFPIAKVAAKLAVGYTLDELRNEVTGGATPASFEPSIDYIVTKVPRFAFEKFPQANDRLTTQMKSVGEVMAIGRTFQESFQKALRGLEVGVDGLNQKTTDREKLEKELGEPGPERIWYVGDAFENGFTLEEVHQLTHIDPWFLAQIKEIVDLEMDLDDRRLAEMDAQTLRVLKRKGFSDRRLAYLFNASEGEVRAARHRFGIRPVYKRVDTCAAEFATRTAYMYSTYEEECEASPTQRKKVIVLGGGPNRIGQGIEFDYCCVHAALALREDGFETVMVNCNPETVSTDYDTSDRLYFEPLTLEDVLEIVDKEKPYGVIVQFGGQTPLKLARDLEANGVPIIGTTPDMIDMAEDRERFQQLIDRLGLKQPANRGARPRARGGRPDERAIRDSTGRHLRARGQPSRLAHSPLRGKSHRGPACQDCRALHGGEDARAAGRARRGGAGLLFGEGSRVPVREVSGRRYHSRPGDEIDRGGDGRRKELRGGLRQIAARREREAPGNRYGAHQRARRRQAGRGARRAGAAQAGLSTACDPRDGRGARRARH